MVMPKSKKGKKVMPVVEEEPESDFSEDEELDLDEDDDEEMSDDDASEDGGNAWSQLKKTPAMPMPGMESDDELLSGSRKKMKNDSKRFILIICLHFFVQNR